MSDKRCDTCQFWVTADRIKSWHRPHDGMGECRVGPPEPIGAFRSRWPLTLADDWCGIHSPPDDEDEDETEEDEA